MVYNIERTVLCLLQFLEKMEGIKQISMVKKQLIILVIIFFTKTLYAQHTSQITMTLDNAINDFTISLISRIPHSKGIAVIAFETENTDLAIYFFDTMLERLWEEDNTMKIYERQKLEILQKELDFSLSGYVSDETAQWIGHFVGVDTIIYGSISKRGNNYRMTLRAANVETGQILFPRSYELIIDSRLANLSGITPPQDAHLWSVGFSIGTTFAAPWIIGTLHGTIAPLRFSFLEIGFDYGMISGVEDVSYYSFYPYLHYTLYRPFMKKGGWYIGAGGGYMIIELDYPEGAVSRNTIAADIITGFNIENIIDISYTLRTNFKAMDNKFSVGYIYRFNKGK